MMDESEKSGWGRGLYICFVTLSLVIIIKVFIIYCHTGQCKRTGGCYNKLVVAFFSTGGGVKGKKNLYLLTLLFIYKLAFILFVMTPGAQTAGNIAVYGSAKQLVIKFMVWTANPTKFWSFAVTGAFF